MAPQSNGDRIDRYARAAVVMSILIVAVLLVRSKLQLEDRGDVVVDVFGDQATYDVVKSATRVEAFLIKVDMTDETRERFWPEATIDEYPITKGPIPVGQETASQLIALITSAKSFDWNSDDKLCAPDPGVRLMFSHEGSQVDVLFCFQCNMLGVHNQQGKNVSREENFDVSRSKIAKLIERIFPEIQLPPGY